MLALRGGGRQSERRFMAVGGATTCDDARVDDKERRLACMWSGVIGP